MRAVIPYFPVITDWFRQFSAHVGRRPDTEFPQALVRLTLVLTSYAYLLSGWAGHNMAISGQASYLGLSALVVSLALLVGCLLDTNVSQPRRAVGMLHDFGMSTYVLAIGGEATAPLVAVYLWVALGNGFRYGRGYMHASAAAAACGFIAVYWYNPFWHAHPPLWAGIWLMLVVVPLYGGRLLGQVQLAVKREQDANRAKSEFLANMSHELRTPLNGVIGVSDLLAETPLNREQQDLTQIIRASADTLLELIDTVLDISRIEAGRIVSTQDDFDLHQLMSGAVAMLRTQAQVKGLDLALHIAPQSAFRLHGDAKHLRQILVNLAGNAIKFTEAGRIDVYVRPAGGLTGATQRLRFEVVDTGIGISEAAQARVFDSFTQADTSITRRFGGTGLGTTIAKQLVEMMGGRIGLFSQEGHGSTFWFEIPFKQQLGNAGAPGALEQFTAPMRIAVLASPARADWLSGRISEWGGTALALPATWDFVPDLAAIAADGGTPVRAVLAELDQLPGDPELFLNRLRSEAALAGLPLILLDANSAEDCGPSAAADRIASARRVTILHGPLSPGLLFNTIRAETSLDMPVNVVSLADRFKAQSGGSSKVLRILVAEDNPVNQRVIRGLLEHAGHEVHMASDGDEALTMLEVSEASYDMAILDMRMPVYSGPEVAQRWRLVEDGHLPIVMLTADARVEAQAACEAAGVDAFLTKPVNSRELVDVIARLAGKPADAAAPQAAAVVVPFRALDERPLTALAKVGGYKFVAELVATFYVDSARSLEGASLAQVACDTVGWHEHLHRLKGVARDMGAAKLSHACREAERLKPYELASEGARQKLTGIKQALAEAQVELTAFLRRLEDSANLAASA